LSEVRYWVALILICLIPGTIAYWFSIHPFIGFWRRFSVVFTMAVHGVLIVMIAAFVASQRKWMLSIEFGNQIALALAGVALLVVAGVLRRKVGSELRIATLLGFPELAPYRGDQPLLTGGLYSTIRHPRYVQLLIALWGWTLLANYLALYVMSVLTMAALHALVLLEERELCDRYGRAYSEYAQRVPRFVPRLSRRRP